MHRNKISKPITCRLVDTTDSVIIHMSAKEQILTDN